MIINGRTDIRRINTGITKAFDPYAHRLDLFFQNKIAFGNKITIEELEKCLIEYDGIAWELEWEGMEIKKIVPFSVEQTIKNLLLQKEDDDIFADFKSRL